MRKIVTGMLILSMVIASSITTQAAINNTQIHLDNDEVMITSEFSVEDDVKIPTMELFDQTLYTEGVNVISLISTTKGQKIPSGIRWLPAGYYVRKARAGLQQGRTIKRSSYTNDGIRTVSMFNNPFQKDYARNNWICSKRP